MNDLEALGSSLGLNRLERGNAVATVVVERIIASLDRDDTR
jgi:hypothetical protein